jgi:predicted nucleic acid-binding protein
MKNKGRLIDTNILVYAYDSSETKKHDRCKAVLKEVWEKGGGVITLQNLMEFFVVVTMKVEKPLPIVQARAIIEDILLSRKWTVIDRDVSTFLKATELVSMYGRHFWDSLIAACMLENDIQEIVTENTKDFSDIPGISVSNPLKSPKR